MKGRFICCIAFIGVMLLSFSNPEQDWFDKNHIDTTVSSANHSVNSTKSVLVFNIVCDGIEANCFADIGTILPTVVDSNCAVVPTFVMGAPQYSPFLSMGNPENCSGAVYNVLWTATQVCGPNPGDTFTAQCTQEVTLTGGAATTISCPANETVTCFLDISAGTPTVDSDCDLGFSIATVGPTLTTGTENCDGATYEIVYTVTDECGDTAQCTQTFTLDSASPVITCPSNIILECGEDTSSTSTGVATATASCGNGVVVTESDSSVSGCGNTETITRTWTATDDCGNTATCQQIITVTDFTPPSITCPANTTVECGGDTSSSATGIATGSDTCGSVTVSSFDTVIDMCGETESISRTWIVSDECGNSSVCSQTITVEDTTPPSITCPANTTVECGGDTSSSSTGVATGSDTCGSVTVSSFDTVIEMCGETESISRTWIVSDECGNSSVCSQTITVEDTTPPSITCPANTTVECGGDTSSSSTGVATGSDTCGSVTVSSFDTVIEMCGDTESISRTWIVSDECGNSSVCAQIITVEDATPPSINCPADVIVECGEDSTSSSTGVATGSDGCGGVVISQSDAIDTSPCGLTGIITRTWTATDECGNTTTCIQTITIDDNTPPVVSCPSNVMDLTCTDALPVGFTTPNDFIAGGGTITEGCGTTTVSFVDSDVVGNFDFCVGTDLEITRTYTITDACGNTSTCDQTFSFVADTAAPMVDCSVVEDMVFECGDPDLDADIQTWLTAQESAILVTATDNCDGTITVSNNYIVGVYPSEKSCGNPNMGVIVTFTIEDGCGNSTTCSGAIILEDTTPPLVDCSSLNMELVLECNSDYDALISAWITMIEADILASPATIDNCTGALTVSNNFVLGTIPPTDCDADPNNGLMIEFIVSDCCNNMSPPCIGLVVIDDTTDPMIVCPANVTVECGDDTSSASTGVATGSDGCGTVTITQSDAVDSTPCGNTETITRTWTATDACSNAVSCVQTITVTDTTDPMIVCPANVTVECGADTSSASTGVATGSDGCGTVTITQSDAVDSTPCGNTETITRTWTATDACGNAVSCVQTITVADTTDPMIVCPANVTVECGADTSSASTGVATGSDGCGTVTITQSDAVDTTPCGLTGVITRTWTATDACGNAVSCVQTITVDDTTDPMIVCPANVTVECGADTSSTSTGVATGSDGCGGVVITQSDSSVSSCGNTETITRTWTATDACGNAVSCVQTITVADTTDPMIVCPANVTVECGADTSSTSTGVATATDGCGGVVITQSDAVDTTPCGLTEIITRTWRATDDCGNTATCEQTITIEDTTDPVITCPADVVVECGADTSSTSTGVATATDGCGGVVITQSDAIDTTPCGLTEIITRTWTATDDCGNTATCEQTITIEDTTDPVITCPADVVIECGEDSTSASTGVATGTDGCGTVTISQSDAVDTTPCGLTGIITRTWTATDDCGNTATCVQTITVSDTTDPMITCPMDVTVECGEDSTSASTGVAAGTDGCGGVVITQSDAIDTTPCGLTGIITRTWTAMDDCGNTATCEQTITIEDTTPSVVTCPPNVMDLTCTDALPVGFTTPNDFIAGGGMITEGCGSTTVSFVDDGVVGDFDFCLGTDLDITRTYTITDACGNESTCEQTFSFVADTEAPTVDCTVVADMVFECGDPDLDADIQAWLAAQEAAILVTASDNCDGTITVSNNYIVGVYPNEKSCGDPNMGLVVTFTIEDGCANMTTCSGAIILEDTTPPLVDCSSVDMELVLECNSDYDALITAWANQIEIDILNSPSTIDNCTGALTASNNFVLGTIPPTDCNGDPANGLMIEFVVSDCCGNMSPPCIGLIVVADTTVPTITCPANATVECGSDSSSATTGEPTSTDACGGVTFTQSDAVDTTPCGLTEIITRTWTATDDCGNTATCEQTITIEDTTDPVITCPANVVVECGTDTSSTSTGVATATDGCGGVVITQSDAIDTTPCGLTEIITRTWTATDDCGNTATCEQTITVEDTTDPTIVCPADTIVECGEDTSSANTGVGTGSDGCGSVTISQSDVVDTTPCGLTEIITRTWTATDDCGNTATCEQVITITDTTPPTITCPADATVECGEDSTSASTGVATGTDGCGGVVITQSDAIDTTPCGLTGIITRTWTATDDCGNTATCEQIITIEDTTSPIVTCPPNETGLMCNDPLPAGFTTAADFIAAGGTITEGCGTTTVTFTDDDDPSDFDFCMGTDLVITRTYTITDACGNTATCDQTFTYVPDTTPPTVDCSVVEDMVFECGDPDLDQMIQDWLAAQEAALLGTAMDNCDGTITVSNNYIVGLYPSEKSCGDPNMGIVITLIVEDQCGNQNTDCFIRLILEDTTPPIADCSKAGMTLSLECGIDDYATEIADWIIHIETSILNSSGTADNCTGTLVISNNYVTGSLPALDCNGNPANGLEVEFVVSDCCGNMAPPCVGVIILDDTTVPVVTCPANVTGLTCMMPVPAAATTQIEFEDLGGVITEDCGINTVTSTDDLDPATFSFCLVDGPFIVTRTYTVTDDCGNTGTCEQTFTYLADTQAPVITCPPNETGFTCTDDLPAGFTTPNDFIAGGGTIDENCSITTVSFIDDADPSMFDFCVGGDLDITRTYTVTDECGNTATCEQIFSFEPDTEAPMVDCDVVEDMVFECGDPDLDQLIQDWLDAQEAALLATATDNCNGTITVSNNYIVGSLPSEKSCGDPNMGIVITLIVEDACGNQNTDCFIRLILEDTTPPVADCSDVGDPLFLECGDPDIDQIIQDWIAEVSMNILNAPGTSDNCTGMLTVTTDYVVGTLPTLDCTGDPNNGLLVEFYVEDCCGNQSPPCIGIIVLDDMTPPVIVCPVDVEVECGESTSSDDTGMPTATDGCDMNVTFSESDTSVDACGGTEVITRTWTATDACGNMSTCEQVITVVDNVPPVIDPLAMDMTVECTDGSDPLQDFEDWLNDNGGAEATDECGGGITWSNSSTGLSDECGDTGMETVIFTATDECGNMATTEATFTITDNTPPTIDVEAMDLKVECSMPDPANQTFQEWLDDNGGAQASDACGQIITWTNDGVLSDDCGGTGFSFVTFTATDECGNTATTQASFTAGDETPPEITVEAMDMTVECDGTTDPLQAFQDWLDDNANAMAEDVCGEVTWTNNSMGLSDECGITGMETVTFFATDECDNTSETEATFTITDTTPPVITCPMDVDVECGDSTDPADTGMATGTDVCGTVSFTFADGMGAGACGPMGAIIRTWTATDECGNTSSCDQTIDIIDTTDPIITCPPNVVDLTCNDDLPAAATTEQEFLDQMGTIIEVCNVASVTSVDDVDPSTFTFCLDDGPFVVTRTYTVTDGCGNSDTCEQTFTYLADTEAPVLTCPVDMTFGTDDGVCNADVVIAPPTFVENCSMVSIVNDYNNTDDPSDNYPLGDTEVIWTATDECGNESTCAHTITIIDDENPVITCNDNICVILEDNGTAFIAATTFLNSATDNCSTVFTVEGMIVGQGPLGAGITFECGNKGPVMVMLVVTDDAGNSASCTVDVEVKDTTAPGQELGGISICPSDLNISCNVIVDFDNMTQFGTIVFDPAVQNDIIIDGVVVGQDGLFTDNCPNGLVIQSIEVNSDDYDNSCNTGEIIRTFTISDASGNTSTCTQTITSINDDPFVCDDVMWPADYETDDCTTTMVDPADSGRPTYPFSTCSTLAQNFDDVIFDDPLSGCTIIERTWTVIDWCQYETNVDDPLGYCEYVQTISIVNAIAPTIESTCMDTMICSNPTTCIGNLNLTLAASDDCTDADDLVYTWSININGDGITFINGSGSTLFANVPMGEHVISWNVEDHCGNDTSCSYTANVQDCKAPTVACKYGLSTTLLPKNGGCVTIWANDFIQSISDNCTDVDDLHISFSADITDTHKKFTCDDLGEQAVEVWVTDEDGNVSYCNTFIDIQDNLDVCGGGNGSGMVMIAGRIATEEDEGVLLAEVIVDATNMNEQDMTDTLGTYEFIDLPMGEDYNVVPEKNDDHGNGVTTIDLVIIQKHLLDIAPLTSPYKLIAADADNSEHISAIDLIQIRKLILGVYDEFPNNTSWRFVDENFDFPEPSNPWPFDEEVMNADMATDAMAVNFVAVKIGDVNGTVETNVSNPIVESRTSDPVEFIIENESFSSGELVTVNVKAKDFNDLVALQYTLDYDETMLEYVAIESANINVTEANIGLPSRENQVLTFSWNEVDAKTVSDNDDIFRISFIAKANGTLENSLAINSDVTAAIAFDSNYEERNVTLRFNDNSSLYSLHQNAPNPFMDRTEVGFTIPSPQVVSLKVYTAKGQLVWEHEEMYEAGDHVKMLTKEDLKGNAGMLYLEINANGFNDTRKMIMLK